METIREKLVLVADDEAAHREMLRRSLSGRNYRVEGAGDGQEALRLARERKPQLILLDLDMPGKTGADVLRELRAGIQTSSIPVLMVTASADVEDKTRAFDLGADDYITKPFSVADLAARMDRQLRRSARALAVDPLTRLPGSQRVEEEVRRRVAQGTPFAFLRIDIDGLGAFNRACGYEMGDELLVATAGVILDSLAAGGLPDDFAGHTGGDDFVAVTSMARGVPVGRSLAESFDKVAARFFVLGAAGQALPPSLSIGVAGAPGRLLGHYAMAVDVAGGLVSGLKLRKPGGGSAWASDGVEGPEAAPR